MWNTCEQQTVVYKVEQMLCSTSNVKQTLYRCTHVQTEKWEMQ